MHHFRPIQQHQQDQHHSSWQGKKVTAWGVLVERKATNIMKVGEDLSDPQAQPTPPCPLTTSPSAASLQFLNPFRDADPTAPWAVCTLPLHHHTFGEFFPNIQLNHPLAQIEAIPSHSMMFSNGEERVEELVLAASPFPYKGKIPPPTFFYPIWPYGKIKGALFQALCSDEFP